MIEFGEWLPDLHDFQNPGATEAKNVIPDFNSYRPMPWLSAVDNSAPAADAQYGFYSPGASDFIYSGSPTHLYRYQINGDEPAAWTDVSRTTGGAYTNVTWRFAKFGNFVIANNDADVPQAFEEGTDTDFSALAGSPPTAKYVTTIRDFVFMAGVSANRNRVYWSAINDAEDWTPSSTTQSDTQDIPDGGGVSGLAGGDRGLVFQKNQIWRVSYVGSPLIFQFDKVTTNVGLGASGNDRSIAQFENLTFFYSDAGFMMLVDGTQLVPIGAGKVDRYFTDILGTFGASGLIYSAAVDPLRKLYMVQHAAEPLSDTSIEYRLLMYHWPSQRWSYVLDANGDLSFDGSLFTCSAGYASSTGAFQRRPIQVGAIGADGRHKMFVGSNLAATLETTEAQIFPGRRAFVQGVRPIIDGGDDADITVAVAARSAPNDTVTFATAVAMNGSGLSPQRSSGRFHRARISIAAGKTWAHAQGVDVDAVSEGQR